MKTSLIEKYDVPTPRYTSYPPLPYWEKIPTQKQWLDHLNSSFLKSGNTVDLYIHIPFCKELCHYCGCNRMECSDFTLMESYVESLLLEWKIYKESLPLFSVASVHLGGGTPTQLPVSLLEKLLEGISKENFSGSAEIDPRVTTKGHLEFLFQKGFRRLSFGIQDFHPSVQKEIGRIQDFELVKKKAEEVRALSFQELNFDLIYGLPGQSLETMEKTFHQVAELRPETLAFYSFAFVPHFSATQKKIRSELIPYGEAKRALYEKGRELLFEQGYKEIGMDHFALEHSSLYKAFQSKELKRSFMGYTVRKAPVLLGLGVSSISSSGLSYIQNEKELSSYQKIISRSELSLVKGHTQLQKDLEVEKMIQSLMCQGETEILGERPEGLDELLDDELVREENHKVIVTEKGRPFLRNIAKVFDYRYKENSKVTFSRSV